MTPAICRCGWAGEGEHPCHADNYTCRRPAKRRLYGARTVALAGMQLKVEAVDTWACNAHWHEWYEMVTFRHGEGAP